MATKTKSEKSIPLKVTFDLLNDSKEYSLLYRTLTVGEGETAKLKKAKTFYRENFSELIQALDNTDTYTEDMDDLQAILEVTPKDDSQYMELLRDKVFLAKDLRAVKKALEAEFDAIRARMPKFTDLTEEYGKIALLELEIQLGGDDAEALLTIAKKDPAKATLIQLQMNRSYRESVEGK